MGSSLWGIFLVGVVLSFGALEIPGAYFGAPWGTMTDFVRGAMAQYTALHFVVAALVAYGYLHLFGPL